MLTDEKGLFFSTYPNPERKKNKFPHIDTSAIDHHVAQRGFYQVL